MHVDLTATDVCGPWQTFVGGGAACHDPHPLGDAAERPHAPERRRRPPAHNLWAASAGAFDEWWGNGGKRHHPVGQPGRRSW